MSCENIYYIVEPCPNCGEKDEQWKWKGARMGSTKWGHDYRCCSDKCGFEFLNSPKHKELERQKIEMEIALLSSRLERLKSLSTAIPPLEKTGKG